MAPTKLSVVAITHNQEVNLRRILEAYARQSLQPSSYCFVLDRCSDNSMCLVQEFKRVSHVPVYVLETSDIYGFRAGYCRDLGLSEVTKHQGETDVLFLDGDCVPTEHVFRNTRESCQHSDIAILARQNQVEGTDNYMEDFRVAAPWLEGVVFKYGFNVRVRAMELARTRQLTWSCSLALSVHAQEVLQGINERLCGQRRVFASVFDGTWGGEDDFVGLSAMLFGLSVMAVDPTHHVKHIWHPSRSHDDVVPKTRVAYEKLKHLAYSGKVPGLKFTEIDPDRYRQAYMQKLIAVNLGVPCLGSGK